MRQSRRRYLSIFRPPGDRGATIVEYVVLMSSIALLLAVSLTALGADVKDFFSGLTALWP